MTQILKPNVNAASSAHSPQCTVHVLYPYTYVHADTTQPHKNHQHKQK